MTSIIRDPSLIAASTTEVLLATYNALTGKSIKKFSSRAAAERQVEMAMLAARDNDAHTGVPKNSAPKVITIAETVVKAAAMGLDVEEATAEDSARIVFTPGSLADQLDKASIHALPIVPRAKKAAAAPAVPRSALMFVRSTGAGKSKVQAASVRGAVLAHIVASAGVPVAVAELDAKFNCNTKGFLQKLIEMNHVAPCAATVREAAAEERA